MPIIGSTEDGLILEFQHSRIKPDERDSREPFYEKLIWVVDGKLRPTYQEQFQKAFESTRWLSTALGVRADACDVLPFWAVASMIPGKDGSNTVLAKTVSLSC